MIEEKNRRGWRKGDRRVDSLLVQHAICLDYKKCFLDHGFEFYKMKLKIWPVSPAPETGWITR